MKLKGKFVKFIENNRKYYGFQVVGNIENLYDLFKFNWDEYFMQQHF